MTWEANRDAIRRGAIAAFGGCVFVLAALGVWHVHRRVSEVDAPRVIAQWWERARRMPAPVLRSPERSSLAAAGSSQLKHFRAYARVIETVSLPDSSPVVSIVEHGGGLVIATFDRGAFAVAPGRFPTALDLGEAVNELASDGTSLYAASDDGAFIVGEGGARRIADGSFTAVAIWQNAVWLASSRGISRYARGDLVTFGSDQGIAARAPAAVAGCGSHLCIGATDGLWLFDGASAIRHSSGSGALPTDYVTAVAWSPRGAWVGTFDGGLSRVWGGAGERLAPSNGLPEGRIQPRALTAASDALFAGTPSGVLWLRGSSVALITDGLPDRNITAVRTNPDGTLWLGSAGRLSRIRLELP